MPSSYGTAGGSPAQEDGGVAERWVVQRDRRKALRGNKIRARAVAKTALVLGCAGVAAVVGVLSSARGPPARAPHAVHPAASYHNVRSLRVWCGQRHHATGLLCAATHSPPVYLRHLAIVLQK